MIGAVEEVRVTGLLCTMHCTTVMSSGAKLMFSVCIAMRLCRWLWPLPLPITTSTAPQPPRGRPWSLPRAPQLPSPATWSPSSSCLISTGWRCRTCCVFTTLSVVPWLYLGCTVWLRVVQCSTMLYHVLPCCTMLYPCSTMLYHVVSCCTALYHVAPMLYHVESC
jgi:hypothetical protein